MFGKRRVPARPTISLRDDSPADEVVRLGRLLAELNDVIEMLWLEVEDLRSELTRARGVGATEVRATFDRPPTHLVPDPSGDIVSDCRVLGILVDHLNGSAESLWYESQWVRSQLASVLEDGA